MKLFGFLSALGLSALGSAITAHAAISATVNGSAITLSTNAGRTVVDAGALTADAVIHVFDDVTSSTTGPSLSLNGDRQGQRDVRRRLRRRTGQIVRPSL